MRKFLTFLIAVVVLLLLAVPDLLACPPSYYGGYYGGGYTGYYRSYYPTYYRSSSYCGTGYCGSCDTTPTYNYYYNYVPPVGTITTPYVAPAALGYQIAQPVVPGAVALQPQATAGYQYPQQQQQVAQQAGGLGQLKELIEGIKLLQSISQPQYAPPQQMQQAAPQQQYQPPQAPVVPSSGYKAPAVNQYSETEATADDGTEDAQVIKVQYLPSAVLTKPALRVQPRVLVVRPRVVSGYTYNPSVGLGVGSACQSCQEVDDGTTSAALAYSGNTVGLPTTSTYSGVVNDTAACQVGVGSGLTYSAPRLVGVGRPLLLGNGGYCGTTTALNVGLGNRVLFAPRLFGRPLVGVGVGNCGAVNVGVGRAFVGVPRFGGHTVIRSRTVVR